MEQKSKEEILKETTVKTLNIVQGSPLHDAVMAAMDTYADQQTAPLREEIEQLNERCEWWVSRYDELVIEFDRLKNQTK